MPEARKIDVKSLFKKEDEEDLEKRLKELPDEERRNVEILAREPITEVYARIKTFAEEATVYERERADRETYAADRAEMERRREIYELALMEKRRAAETGEYEIDKKKEHLMTAAERLTYKKL